MHFLSFSDSESKAIWAKSKGFLVLWLYWGALVGNIEGGRKAKFRYLFLHLSPYGFICTGCCFPLKITAPTRWSSPHGGCLLLGSVTGFYHILACPGVVIALLLALGYCTLSCVFSISQSQFVNCHFIKPSPTYHDVCVHGHHLFFPVI